MPAFEQQLLHSTPAPGQADPQTETETEMSELDTDTEKTGQTARFVKELRNFKVPEGQSITLSARVEGPRPTVSRW